MRARDLILVGAVMLLVGFAAFDAIRGEDADDRSSAPTQPVTTSPDTTPVELAPEPEPLPRGVLEGSLLFAEVSQEGPLACPLRLVYLRTGEERRFPQDTLGCSVSAPRTGPAVAKSIGDELSRNDELRYRIIDPGNAERAFPQAHARDARLAWSLDGRRVLWCTTGPTGIEWRVGRRAFRSFRPCADGYTAAGERFSLQGTRLVVSGRVILERPEEIDQAVWSPNGSVGLVVGGRRLERWSNGRLDAAVALPEDFAFSPTYFSPDNCAAVVLAGMEVYLFELGCFPAQARFRTSCGRRIDRIIRCFPWFRPSSFFGHHAQLAAWSPDEGWIAVVEADAIVFHRLPGVNQYNSFRWEVRAATLAWR